MSGQLVRGFSPYGEIGYLGEEESPAFRLFRPGSLAITGNVGLVFDHLDRTEFANTVDGTAAVWASQRGLEFEAALPMTAFANTVATAVRNGSCAGISLRCEVHRRRTEIVDDLVCDVVESATLLHVSLTPTGRQVFPAALCWLNDQAPASLAPPIAAAARQWGINAVARAAPQRRRGNVLFPAELIARVGEQLALQNQSFPKFSGSTTTSRLAPRAAHRRRGDPIPESVMAMIENYQSRYTGKI